MKIYKAKNKNRRRVGVLFILQIIFGTLPAALLLFFVFAIRPEGGDSTLYIGAYISAAAIILCGFAYTILGRRYNILLSGLKGEKALYKIAKKHRSKYAIFLNVPVRYKQNRSEIDMLMVGRNGIIIVEVKNHSGTISGGDKDDMWTQQKHYKDGRATESEIKNPFKQLSRQREILKNILRSNGHNIWIDGVVFFSNPFVKLNLGLSDNSFAASGNNELNDFINSYRGPKPLSDNELEEITNIIRNIL